MWPRSSAPPLVIELNRSVFLAVLVSLTHIGAFVCLWLAPVPFLAQVPVTVLTVFSAVYSMRRYALLGATRSVVRLEWHSGGWLLTDQAGTQHSATLMLGSMRSRLLTVLLFLTNGKRSVSVPICRDMLDPDDYRRLQQRLTIIQAADESAEV